MHDDSPGGRGDFDSRQRHYAAIGSENLRRRAGLESSAGAAKEHAKGDGGVAPEDFKWFHYIPIEQRAQWEALGWRVKELPDYHGQYSYLGEWTGGGPPVKP